ncbi:MAG: hypothetical protein ACRD2W_04620 [Acidimicrobiales bacterium]
MAEERFAWLDNLVQWCTLRLMFATGRSWQDMLATVFGLDPARAVGRSLDDQVEDPPDRPTIRAGEHQGWGYTVQTTIDLDVYYEQLGRLSLRGEAFALIYTLSSVTFAHASDGSPTWFFDMTTPSLRERNALFEAAISEAGFDDGLPHAGIKGARFVELAFGITLTRDMIEGSLPSVVRPTEVPALPRAALPTEWPWPQRRPGASQ